MNRHRFEQQNEKSWQKMEDLLDGNEGKERSREDLEKLPNLFRQCCNDLSLAEYRMYGQRVCNRLNRLVMRGYAHLYRNTGAGIKGVVHFLAVTFPQAIRSEWRLFWLCMLFFWGPFFAMLLAAEIDPRWVQATLGPEGMAGMEMMYGEDANMQDYRDEHGSDFKMFCFYIYNNIGIDFRMFAGGIFAGVGTLFFLLFNGLHIGAASGYVHYACDPEKFYCFTSGHSSFELLGAVIAGMAGMRLGLTILRPGEYTRKEALRRAGKKSAILIYGAATMTFIAAIIEGFWSAEDLLPAIKYTVGITFWVLLILYFTFSGRRWSA